MELVAELLMFISALERLDPSRSKKLTILSSKLTDQSQLLIPKNISLENGVSECKVNPLKRKREIIDEEDEFEDEDFDDVDDVDEGESDDISYQSGDDVDYSKNEIDEDSNFDEGDDGDNEDFESYESDVNISESSVGSMDTEKISTEMVTSPEDWAKLTFEQRLKQLEIYKKKYGHCKVPQLYKENPSMGLWVRDLRVKKRKGKLPSEVEKRLSKLGFVWNCRKRKKAKSSSKRLPWNERYSQLKNYYEKHGHCKVPSNHKNKQLYHWVTNQRRDFRCGVMPYSRVQKLESIGFEWNSQRKKIRKKFKTSEDDHL